MQKIAIRYVPSASSSISKSSCNQGVKIELRLLLAKFKFSQSFMSCPQNVAFAIRFMMAYSNPKNSSIWPTLCQFDALVFLAEYWYDFIWGKYQRVEELEENGRKESAFLEKRPQVREFWTNTHSHTLFLFFVREGSEVAESPLHFSSMTQNIIKHILQYWNIFYFAWKIWTLIFHKTGR